MKTYVLIIFLVHFISIGKGQPKAADSNYPTAIKQQAEIMGEFMVKKDFKGLAKYTYPKIVTMMGGDSMMAAKLEEGFNKMEAAGYKFLSVHFGEPSKVIFNEKEIQCTVPQILEMKVPNGRIVATSALIGISLDNGNNWYFIDASSAKDIQTLRETFPNLSSALVVPEKKQPTFFKDTQ